MSQLEVISDTKTTKETTLAPPIIQRSTLSPRPKARRTRSVWRGWCREPRTTRFFGHRYRPKNRRARN